MKITKDILWSVLIVMMIYLIFRIVLRYITYEKLNTEHFKNNSKNKNKNKNKNVKENFADTPTTPTSTSTTTPYQDTTKENCSALTYDEWNSTPEEIEKQKTPMSKMQECQIKNLIKDTVRTQVMESLSAQNPLMTGPAGPPGPPGPAGTTLLASGRLVNQSSSYDSSDTKYSNPKKMATRTSGTNPNASLIYMGESTPFASYQSWQYNQKNQIVNRYDGACLTYIPNQEKLSMTECDDNNTKQKWFWDKANRFVLLDTSQNKPNKLKCISVSAPQTDSLMTTLPDCKGTQCTNTGSKEFLITKDCDPNTVESSTIFSFI